jgi:hypothetical protein
MIRSRVPTQSPKDPQRRIHRERKRGRDLHPVPVPASMSFAPADATWISAAACSDRPWSEPSVRLFGTQIEKAARRGRGPDRAGSSGRTSISTQVAKLIDLEYRARRGPSAPAGESHPVGTYGLLTVSLAGGGRTAVRSWSARQALAACTACQFRNPTSSSPVGSGSSRTPAGPSAAHDESFFPSAGYWLAS